MNTDKTIIAEFTCTDAVLTLFHDTDNEDAPFNYKYVVFNRNNGAQTTVSALDWRHIVEEFSKEVRQQILKSL